jgi:hypothetical protein
LKKNTRIIASSRPFTLHAKQTSLCSVARGHRRDTQLQEECKETPYTGCQSSMKVIEVANHPPHIQVGWKASPPIHSFPSRPKHHVTGRQTLLYIHLSLLDRNIYHKNRPKYQTAVEASMDVPIVSNVRETVQKAARPAQA